MLNAINWTNFQKPYKIGGTEVSRQNLQPPDGSRLCDWVGEFLKIDIHSINSFKDNISPPYAGNYLLTVFENLMRQPF